MYDQTRAQQRLTIQELETPVIQLWAGILLLPLVGSIDTHRAQLMDEALLDQIIATDAEVGLLDLTGVLVVDTAVAKHLLETVTAAGLLGAEVIIVGLAPRIAITMVQLGLDLNEVRTRGTLAQGLAMALERLGLAVVPRGRGGSGGAGNGSAIPPPPPMDRA